MQRKQQKTPQEQEKQQHLRQQPWTLELDSIQTYREKQ
jgi:hypothetical protein